MSMNSNVFIKLEEGRFYNFKFDGAVSLPDGKSWYKLIDPNGIKHLIPAEPYLKYGFKKGTTIHCRIDHINCAGKIFIEPEHPCYQVGQKYKFNFESYALEPGSTEFNTEVAILTDCFKQKIILPARDIIPLLKNKKIEATVTRIKKGSVFISVTENQDTFLDIEHCAIHLFKVIRLIDYRNHHAYYICEDKEGRKYNLRRKYYEKYNLKPGSEIKCRMIREGDSYYFEPEHPVYKIGLIYDFEILGKTQIEQYPEGTIPAYIIRNDYGKVVFLPCKNVNKKRIIGNMINCMVADIRKSMLLLECK